MTAGGGARLRALGEGEPAQRWYLAAVTAAILAGALFRVSGALTTPLWDDEARQAVALSAPLDLEHLASWPLNLRPILYVLLSKATISLYDAEWMLRASSLAASLAALPLTWAVARRLLSSRLAIAFAVAAVALSPWLIDFAKEYKPYALEHCLVTLQAYLAVRYLAERRRRWLVGLALTAALSPLLGFACIFVAPWLLLVVAVDARARRDRWALAAAGAGMALTAGLFAAQYALLSSHATRTSFQYWSTNFYDTGFTARRFAQHWYELTGQLAASSVTWASWPAGDALVGALGVALFAAGVAALVSRRRWGVLVVVVGALALPLLASFAGRWPFGMVRVNLFLVGPVVLAWAVAIDAARAARGRLGVAAAAAVAVLAALQLPVAPRQLLAKQIPAAHMRPVLRHTDMPALLSAVLAADPAAGPRPGQPCAHVTPEAQAQFTYYARQRAGRPAALAELRAGRALDANTRYATLEVSAALRGEPTGCWLVRSSRYDEQLAARRALRDGGFRVLAEVTAPGLVATRIERLPAPVPMLGAGALVLRAQDAVLHGRRLWYYGRPHIGGVQGVDPRWAAEAIGNWIDPDDWVSWRLALAAPARVEVRVRQAAVAPAGADYEVQVGGERVQGAVVATPSWRESTVVRLGALSLPAGVHRLEVRVTRLRGAAAMNLRAVELVPAEAVGGAAPGAARAAAPSQRVLVDSGT